MIKPETKLIDLLRRFPAGYIVNPDGYVFGIHSAHAGVETLVNVDNVADYLGLVVAINPSKQPGDDKYFDNSQKQPEPPDPTEVPKQQSPEEVSKSMEMLKAKLKQESQNPYMD